jgi:HK97 gp10 family phage protein
MAQTSRVVLNRKAFEQVDLAIADGLFAVAEEVIAVARPPDAPPYGQGLVEGGGAIAYLGGKKVNGTTIGGKQVKKPRSLKVRDGEPVAIAGFGFPARFVELGTVDTPAEPFLTPAVFQVEPDADVILSKEIKRRLAGFKDARAAERFG